jgi:hypothetical protein
MEPAVEASGVQTPARIYDLRSTFASNALAAGVTVFELAKVMGTSVAMIERHYGTLIGGAHAGMAGRLDARGRARGGGEGRGRGCRLGGFGEVGYGAPRRACISRFCSGVTDV